MVTTQPTLPDERDSSWDTPSFVDADNPSDVLTAGTLREYTKRIGKGLRDVAGVKPGEVVVLSAPNSILVPPSLLGIMCAGAVFSGANPNYTSEGQPSSPSVLIWEVTIFGRAGVSNQGHEDQGRFGWPAVP